LAERLRAAWADERGVVGGMEALPFGLLVFVIGTLLVANAWGVIDAKLASSAAAREAARAYVEAPDAEAARARAVRAAADTITGHGRSADRMELAPVGGWAFHRCARVTFEVTYRVPTITVPWVGRSAGSVITTRARHSEIVDPFRDGVPLAPGQQEATCA
jgi:Flp pilus assembly protein TadG